MNIENSNHGTAEYGMPPAGALASLHHRNYRLFWTGQCFSLVGTWIQNMAQSWLVLELTGSPFLLGLMGAFQFGPILLFSLFAGVVADRFPKRKLIIFTQSANMILALILGLLTLFRVVKYWQVALLAFLLGTVNTLDVPARQSFMIELVGKKDLMNAIALNSSIFNGARILGPALAGLIIAQVNIAACFLINSASFLAVLAGLFMMRVEEERPVSSLRAKRDFAGVRVPHELRGRVMSIYFLLFAGMMPVGSLFSGTVTKHLGAPAGFLVSGCLGLLVVLAVLWRAVLRRSMYRKG